MSSKAQGERDFPLGHPKSADYDPESPEAVEWRRQNVWEHGERAYHADHPLTLNPELNKVEWKDGVDPFAPEKESPQGEEKKEES